MRHAKPDSKIFTKKTCAGSFCCRCCCYCCLPVPLAHLSSPAAVGKGFSQHVDSVPPQILVLSLLLCLKAFLEIVRPCSKP